MGKAVKKVVSVATLGLSDTILNAQAPAATGSGIPAPETSPTAVSEGTLDAREAQRKRQLAAAGLSGTNLTGASGLSGAANTATKTLLGS